MKYSKKIIVSIPLLFLGVFFVAPKVSADGCSEYTEAPSSLSPEMLTIIDTEVGTDAYQRLATYSIGGHKAIGMAIAGSYNYLDKCQYVGIGIGDGSGGNGFRPNYTLAIWYEGIDLTVARSAIYSLIGASATPVVTNGDCNISCDGTTGRQFDGTIVNETTTTLTAIPTTQVLNEKIFSAPTTQQQQAVIETTTTTTTTVPSVLALSNSSKETTQNTITKKLSPTSKKKIKKVVVHRK